MSQGLSVLARLLRDGQFEKFNTGESGPRTNSRMPALPGFTRGSLGSSGSTFGPKTRNPEAQEDEERAMLNNPLMISFLGGGK